MWCSRQLFLWMKSVRSLFSDIFFKQWRDLTRVIIKCIIFRAEKAGRYCLFFFVVWPKKMCGWSKWLCALNLLLLLFTFNKETKNLIHSKSLSLTYTCTYIICLLIICLWTNVRLVVAVQYKLKLFSLHYQLIMREKNGTFNRMTTKLLL